MMGLLDSLGSDEGLLGLYLMSAGAAKPQRTSLGEGLLGGMQLMRQLQDQREAKAIAEQERQQKALMQTAQMKLIDAQVGDTKAQEAQRLAAAKKAEELQAAVDGLLSKPASSSQYGLGGGGINLGGVSEPMKAQASGLAGVPIEAIAGLKAKGGPDLLDAWKLANLGQQVQPGWVQKADGSREYLGDPTKGYELKAGRVSLMPGAAESQATLAGLTKGAEARASGLYDLVQGEGPDGKPGYVGTRTSIADRFNQPQTIDPANDQGPVPLSQVAAEMRDSSTKFANPATRIALERALSQQRASVQPQGQFVPTGQGPAEKAVTEAMTLGNQSFMKDRYAPALETGDAATQTIASVQAARQALNSLGKTGWGTPTVAAAASVLGSLGVPQAERFASSSQMFQSAAMGKLWTTLNAAKGPQTEGDADRASKTFARLENTPEANQFILDMTQATAERERLKAQYFREALPLAQKSGDLQEIERRWSRIAPSVFSLPMMKRWAQ